MKTSLLDSIGGSFHLEIRKQDLLLFLLLALVASTIMFWRLGEGSLGDYDEADYAQSAREMLWWNDFNTPRWNGMEFFDKPPLGLWLTTLAYKVFGVNEFSARLVSATSGVLVVLLIYLLGREMFNSRAIGLGAAAILLTISRNLSSHSSNFVSLARMGQLDMLLILLMTLSVWLAWRAQRAPRALLWLGIPLGLGLMAKSIAGFMAYGIVGLYFLTSLRYSPVGSSPPGANGVPPPAGWWWRKETLWGILLSAMVALPWHLGQLLIWGRHFWNSYMVSLTVGYVTGDQGHTRDAFFYLRSIQRGFPVLYPLVALAVAYGAYRVLRRYCVSPTGDGRISPVTSRQDAAAQDDAILLLLCWTAVPFVLYNLSRSKIGWYMIPIYPALALLTMNLLSAIASSVLRYCAPRSWRSGKVAMLQSRLGLEAGGVLALLAVLVATRIGNPVLPPAKDFNPDVKAVATYSRYVLDKDDVLVNYWPGSYWIRPSALFYADRPLLLVTDEDALRRVLAAHWLPQASAPRSGRGGNLYVLTDGVYWEPVQNLGSVMYASGDYLLAQAHSPTLTSGSSQ
jgi:4-amino-4-deoxy-L-arabinose transferase-like glycosyltransferase